MEELYEQVYLLKLQLYALLGIVMFAIIVAVILCWYCSRKLMPLTSAVSTRVYPLSVYDDDDASYITPLGHVNVCPANDGIIIEHVSVRLRNTEIQPVEIELNVSGNISLHRLDGDYIMPYVGMSDTAVCYLRTDSVSVLVECTTAKQLVPAGNCSILQLSSLVELTTAFMQLDGVRLSETGFEYIFLPVFLYRQFYNVKIADFTQVFKWDGTNYRMLSARGGYLKTSIIYSDAVRVKFVIGLKRRPHWKYKPEVA